MAVDFGAFAKGFLDRSQQIMDENSEEAKEFEKRQRELADRNVGVVGKRRSTATAVLSAAKGLSNLGVPKSVIRLAISTPGGLAELKKKIDTARTEMGAEWNADLIESYVDLPEEFQDNELLQQDGVSLKDFVYNTYGLSTPSLGPTSEELETESSGKFSMFDDFFNKNAMEKARTELGNEMIYGDMSVSEINKLAKQDEYSSQIEGAYVDYKNPNFVTPKVQKNFLDDLNDIKQEWRRQNASQLTDLEDRRETLDKVIRTSTNTSEANAALEVERQTYISQRNRLLSSLSQNMNSTVDAFKKKYGPDNINELLTSRIEQYLSIDTPLDLSMRGTGRDGPGLSDGTKPKVSVFEDAKNLDEANKTLNTATTEMLPGSTSGNYIIKHTGGDTTNGYTTEVRTDPKTGLVKVVTRNANNQIIPSLSFQDEDNNTLASLYLEGSPELDFRVKLKNTAEQFAEFQKVKKQKPVVTQSDVGGVSTEALNSAQTFFKGLNLTSSIDKSELNTATRKYYNSITGELDKEKIKKEVRLWATNTYNKGRPRAEHIDVAKVFGIGKSSLDELTDNIFNLLMKTESPDVKTSSSSEEVITEVDAPEVTSELNLDGLGGSPNIDKSIFLATSATKEPSSPNFENIGLMSKPFGQGAEEEFVSPESPEEPGKPINLRELKKKQDAQEDLSRLPPRSEFMVEYGDEIVELLLDRKNINLKNVKAGRISQINNALDMWKRENKGVTISAKAKKDIIAQYIKSKGK